MKKNKNSKPLVSLTSEKSLDDITEDEIIKDEIIKDESLKEEVKASAEALLKEREKIVTQYKEKHFSGTIWLFKTLAFIGFGISLFYNPFDPLNLYNIGLGVVICLFLGWFFKHLLRSLLSLFNTKLKKATNKAAIHHCVNRGMLFVVPFSVMAIVATFGLDWSINTVLISTAIMSAGMSSSMELGRLAGKSSLKNTVITSVVSYLVTFGLTLSIKFLNMGPGLLEGLGKFIPTLLGKGGGL